MGWVRLTVVRSDLSAAEIRWKYEHVENIIFLIFVRCIRGFSEY